MKRILVCEDEDVIREFVVINLKRVGYEVYDVNCGEEALRVFDAANGNFDIVSGMQGAAEAKLHHWNYHAVRQDAGNGQSQRLNDWSR